MFPFTYLAAPIVGLLAYTFGVLIWWRRYVSILIASLLPAVVGVIIYIVNYESLDNMDMCIVTSHTVAKMLLAVSTQKQIAVLLVENDKRKRKRLRKRGGDAFSETGFSPVFSAGIAAI